MTMPDVTLHIGAMKTGTTYIQRMLGGNAESLNTAGILYPQPWSDQVEAVRDVLNLKGGSHLGSISGRWQEMVQRLHSADCARAILSVEFLSFASEEQVQQIVGTLRPSSIQVVLGARDLGRALPAQWQTSVRNGRASTYRQYTDGVCDGRDSATSQHFWKRQDVGRIASRWVGALGKENVTVVTVPPRGSDPSELWNRISQAMRLDTLPLVQRQVSNESLGPTATELLRRIDLLAQVRDMDNWTYQHGVNRALSHAVLPHLTDPHPSLRLPPSAHQWAMRETTRVVNEVRDSGAQVIGSLTELEPELDGSDSFLWPEDIPDADLLDLAVGALTAMAEQAANTKRAALPGSGGRRGRRQSRQAEESDE